ncbi:DUF6882 domain-containing protein [Roseateles depolymerans]|uniref:Putative integron gene cassette protein n=2 Tax=Roseateles depolymerans TaxID=76731 RepID=A0A0U3L354_9BURK|nr:DUF6882 domain-containing protein [Roseateles depolymerans]ALV05758.1 Putative integron gene cassette protein [Roseateles depolymerans]REG12970.1 hypothetical protein DES44_4344 [Roseateles depolymerans]
MRDITQECSIIGEELVAFIANRPFDIAYVEYIVSNQLTQTARWFKKDSVTTGTGPTIPRELERSACKAARTILEALNENSSHKAWGFNFVLDPNGSFRLEYIYDKPSWIDSDDDDEISEDALIGPKSDEERAAMAWLQSTTNNQTAAWNLGKEKSWNINTESGNIHWTFPDGSMRSASVQLIGTLQKENSEFRWAWSNPSVPEALRQAANTLRQWGKTRGLPEFLETKTTVDELRAWSWTALAAQLSNADGGYRVDTGNGTWLYLVFSNVRPI